MEATRDYYNQRGTLPKFNLFKLTDLEGVVGKEQIAGKYVFLADMSGQAAKYFDYQQKVQVINLGSEIKKIYIRKT